MTLVLLRVLCPCFLRKLPPDPLIPLASLASSGAGFCPRSPGQKEVEGEGRSPNRVGQGEMDWRAGDGEALTYGCLPGLAGCAFHGLNSGGAHGIKYIEVIRL